MTPAAKPATVHDLNEKAAASAAATPDPAVIHHHDNLSIALFHVLNELEVVGKSRTADAGSYKYDYADLEACAHEAKRVGRLHGLAFRTPVRGHGDGLAVVVTFVHESGETLADEPLPFARGANAQATGSAITYFRRYALCASLNLITGEDDDGAKATAAPAFVWTHGAVKARLVELLDGDKTAAKEAWTLGHGGEQEPTAALADRLADEWRANQPAEPASVPVVEPEDPT